MGLKGGDWEESFFTAAAIVKDVLLLSLSLSSLLLFDISFVLVWSRLTFVLCAQSVVLTSVVFCYFVLCKPNFVETIETGLRVQFSLILRCSESNPRNPILVIFLRGFRNK